MLDWDPDPLPQKGHSPQFCPCLLWPNGCMDQDTTWYGGSLGSGDIVLDGDPASLAKKGQRPPSTFLGLGPFLLWSKGWMDHDAISYGGRPQPWPHCVRWGPTSQMVTPSPIFSPCLLWANGWMNPYAIGREVDRGPGDIVLDGVPALPAKVHSPQFSAHVCCDQAAGWIKMPLGTEVGLRPGGIVLDGDPAPSPFPNGTQPPVFGLCLLWPNALSIVEYGPRASCV